MPDIFYDPPNRSRLVVLSGAGISAESGLKTFRDSDGLWMGYNIEDVATPRAFQRDPQLVLDFYNMRRRDVANAQPNEAHIQLAKLEEKYHVTIITQNIDDLHERAGSSRVLHLHGEIFKMRSSAGPDYRHITDIRGDIKLGDLAPDQTQYRPHIVWFEEAVPMIETAAEIMQAADIFLLVGTSLQVYPAAGLIHYLPEDALKFVLDKKVPPIQGDQVFTIIEKPATEGIHDFLNCLQCIM
ncbi:MAG TPA: NAD-dependent protein deacylase [Chitinophagaceae bacterium]|nr:NAD-dependent protein deacylase [Chitinophagaceae bacterium]HRF25875.1 Sir2 family NAD-dependent protein deacetylase [Ferruginibacter sp.]